MRFDLTDLKLFCDVVDAGSITAGAARANLALAAASTRIRGMEQTLGVALLVVFGFAERTADNSTSSPSSSVIRRLMSGVRCSAFSPSSVERWVPRPRDWPYRRPR